MAKYNVLKKFRDKETKEVYEAGTVIDMTVKRAEEKKDDKKAGKDDQKEDKKEK